MKTTIYFIFLMISVNCVKVFSATCDVYNYTQLVQCISNNSTINLRSDIVLELGQKIYINNVNNLVINGKNGANKHSISETSQRFAHVSQDSDHYIFIRNSTNISIENIAFRSNFASDTHCAYNSNSSNYHNRIPCYGDVMVKDSSHVRIYKNDFYSKKTFQLQMVDVFDIWVDGNAFYSSATYGIWTDSHIGNLKDVRIVYNNFELAGANAILLAGAHNAWVGNNTFSKNHRLTQFWGFGGGQLLFEDNPTFPLTSLDVTGNLIQAMGYRHSTGIEFANFDDGALRDVKVSWNRIVGNYHHAIVFDESVPASKLSNVLIANNEFVENNTAYVSQFSGKAYNDIEIRDNWVRSGTRALMASFSETSKICYLQPNNLHCNVDIRWSVDYQGVRPNPIITVRSVGSQIGTKNRGIFSSGVLNGTQSAPWIDENGAIFELYERSDYDQPNGWEAPLASIKVHALRR